MKETVKNKLRLSLAEVIDGWWGSIDFVDFPYVGENICEHMAESALNVLFAVDDVQDYLKSQGMFDETGGQNIQ